MELRPPRLSSAKPTARRFASGQLALAFAAAACSATPSAPDRPAMQAASAPATPSVAPATSAAVGVASATSAAAGLPSTAPSSAPGCPDDMVALPVGSFTMSASDKQTTVGAFCIDRTEVTVAAYFACVRTGACTAAKEMASVTTHLPQLEREMWAATCNAPIKDRGLHPMNCVNWHQADAFCRAQHKRLPTEEEWEWAARGGPANNRFPWGGALPTVELLNATDSTSAAFGARLAEGVQARKTLDTGRPEPGRPGTRPPATHRPLSP